MRDLFPGHYRPSDEELKAIWADCVFVLDANILLNLYRYPKDARNDFLSILKEIKDRLWIPHQAALEFQQNRLTVIAEQLKRFRDLKNAIEDHRNKFRASLDELNLTRRHSSIDVNKLLVDMAGVFDPFMAELDKLEKSQPNVNDPDEIRPLLDNLLQGKVGNCPTKEWLSGVVNEGKVRHARNLPPGFRDKNDKKDEHAYLHNSLVFQRQFGDNFLWQEIVDKSAKDVAFKHVIFVTDDNKEDWWWVVESGAKKTMGPRPELVEEIMLSGNVKGFYMYNPERFVEYAQSTLGIKLREETIEEVREVSESRSSIGGAISVTGFITQAIIFKYIDGLYPDSEMLNSINFDFSIKEAGINKVFDLVDVRRTGQTDSNQKIVRWLGKVEVLQEEFDDATCLVLVESGRQATTIADMLQSKLPSIPKHIAFEIGFVDQETSFSRLALFRGWF